MFKKISLYVLVAGMNFNASAGVLPLNTSQPAPWVESAICTVVLRAPIDAGKSLP